MSKQKIRVVSAAIRRGGRYLITQRKSNAVLPLLWEFPGGRVESGESDKDALRRELSYRLGIQPEVADQIASTERDYSDYTVELHLYRCALGPVEPNPLNVEALQWARPDELDSYTFAPADQSSMDALLFGGKK